MVLQLALQDVLGDADGLFTRRHYCRRHSFLNLRFMKQSSSISSMTLIMTGHIGMLIDISGDSNHETTAVIGIIVTVGFTDRLSNELPVKPVSQQEVTKWT
jgi:hypothetical protein